MVKKIDAFVQKNDMGDKNNQRKLQKKMEKYHRKISGKQKNQSEPIQIKPKKINFTKRLSFLFNLIKPLSSSF